MNTFQRKSPLALAVTAILSAPFALSAQETDDSVKAVEAHSSLETITVTSRKVAERIIDIPVAISAFTAEDIRRKNLDELEDVALNTPGLSYEDFSNGGYGNPVIRGASQFSVDQLEQNVSVFVDGVYIPRQYAIDIGTTDIERIEVVKGPQSALYGANAFMGAINYVTRSADLDEMYGDVEVVLGDGGRQDFSGEVSVPIIEGKLAIKLNAAFTEYDGDWKNSHPRASEAPEQGTDEDLGGYDNDSYGVSIAAQPLDDLQLELAYTKYNTLSEVRASSRLEYANGDLNCGNTVFGFNKIYCGELPETPTVAGTTEESGFIIDPRSYTETESEMLRFQTRYQINDKLSATYQFANIQSEIFAAGNSDRDPTVGTLDFITFQTVNYFAVAPSGDFDYSTHELRMEYQADNGIYALFGIFKSDGDDYDNSAYGYARDLLDPESDIEVIVDEDISDLLKTNLLTKSEAKAIFGRVSVPLLDKKLVLAAEARYSQESKNSSDDTGNYTYEDNFFTPRISIDYHSSNDQLFYGSIAKGIKSGGINSSVVRDEFFVLQALGDDERFYGADENITYEVGTKGRYLDGDLEVSAALYYIDWSDLQVSVAAAGATSTTSTITSNLGAATLKGFELSSSYALTDHITIDGGLALNDGSYDDGVISQRIATSELCDDVLCSSDGNIGGNELARSPKTQWNVGIEYSNYYNDEYEYFVRADLVGQSDQYVSELNLATIPSRALLNLRAGINNENWSAELWVKNATDEEYVSNAFYIPSAFFVSYVPTWGNLRRMGVTVKYNF
ncbi:TonB-dependent receptor [Alteromonas sp. C1M14]|uniref:TonB-dependent receptor n=1 Tax=Alteromonas sp. C1M14 TaxID=2841567 RepID=UPI001C08995F|nr:TonB-dependent receptor [Alteromonas sp. C1M14]MBU2980013.1 TonB-dependent receptor [Alteromonas sp. C1M14]